MSSNNPLRVGIVGYGVVGKRRRQFIDANPYLQTVAVSDIKFKGRGNLPDGVHYCLEFPSLFEHQLDVLFVSVPNYVAPQATIAGLERGLHVFCEKPPGRSVEDIRRVIAAEKKVPHLKLKYGFNHRYHDSVRDALRHINSGEFGEIINVRGIYGKSKIIPFDGGWRAERKYAGGGILLDQGIHMVDLMQLFCSDFVEVKSFVSNNYWKHDVEDNAYALMRDSRGRIAMLHSSATQWQHRFLLDIALERGFLSLKGILSGSKSYGEERLTIGRRDESDTGAAREETFTYLEDNSWRDEINEFADAIVNEKSIVNGSSLEALKTMKLVYGIYAADPDWSMDFKIEAPDGIKVSS